MPLVYRQNECKIHNITSGLFIMNIGTHGINWRQENVFNRKGKQKDCFKKKIAFLWRSECQCDLCETCFVLQCTCGKLNSHFTMYVNYFHSDPLYWNGPQIEPYTKSIKMCASFTLNHLWLTKVVKSEPSNAIYILG